MVHTTVVFPVSASSFNFSQSDSAVTLSRPLVGSSRNSNNGWVNSSIATHKRFLSPPEIPFFKLFPTITLRTCDRPISTSASFTRCPRISCVGDGGGYVRVYVCMSWYINTCMHVRIYACTDLSIYVSTYLYMYISMS